MDNAFVIRKIFCISIPGVVKSKRRIVCPLFQNSCGVGFVELSVLFLIDDEMVQLCVTPAEYGQRLVPRKDRMFRRLGRVDPYQRRYTSLAFNCEEKDLSVKVQHATRDQQRPLGSRSEIRGAQPLPLHSSNNRTST